ncbi:glycosyltransferase family 4 protein [Geminocystis sp. NIES-3709]|uniref:glycosyltransferase family 4 protein n=1 Tax=Geminocystis sp. NIES-3709 TaxID=1617448 RepID=UPI0005FC560F|nr:glycosyltransferase [Geminocystis sp. NIES-3709]BAQ65668.1 glycosyltransferase [Geminocystis sp. NIES-3709]
MIKVLHIIDFLSLGGAARSMIAISKYSTRLDNQFHHQVISLKKATPDAIELAQQAGMEFLDYENEQERNEIIASADLVHIHYWNNPQMFSFLHSELPPLRLMIWFHVSGDNAPQVITRDLINFADFAIPCNPHSYDLPVVKQLAPEIRHKKVAMVYDAADFDRVQKIQPQAHEGFNVGYMGTLSFSKMHPNYISMSAKANIPDVKFILCGGGDIELLKQQASEFNAVEKFDFRGFVEEIASEIAKFDVYGYPLCEDTYAAAELNLQEVMYAGIPPVVFPHGGIKKLIINNYTGLIVENELEYSQALEYLYHNPQERLRLGKNAKEYASQIFGAENAAKQLNPIYDQLMEMPKRRRHWSIPVDGSLLDEPVSIFDVIDIPSQFSGAKTFIESLGDTAPQFMTNLTSQEDSELFASDDEIANSSTLLGMGEGGVIQYLNYFPDDGYLRFWTALVLEKQGKVKDALGQYIMAINKGYKHWRVFWYLAQVADFLQEIDVLQQALNNLDHYAPNFKPTEVLRQKLNQLLLEEQKLSLPSFNLSNINYLIFPDWQTDEEILTRELSNLIQQLASNNLDELITLIIDTTGITEEDANLFLSGIAMNLMLEAELDLDNTLDFALVNNLNESQWQKLLTNITARVALNCDNQELVNQSLFEDLITINGDGNNYVIFPDWTADQEELAIAISEVFTKIYQQENITLLVNLNNADAEEVGLFISEVAMNLMLEKDIELSENISISFVNFNDNQWQSLGSLINAKITLSYENMPDNLSLWNTF